MYARASTYSGDMNAFMTHFQSVIVALEQWNGLDHVDVYVDREHGRALTVSVWADREAMDRSDAGADEMRERVTSVAGVTTESTERFELLTTIRGPASKEFLPFAAAGP
jgi:quinol monooxygenase YgiN